MSDIWGLSSGGSAADDAKTDYEMPGGSFEVIPEGSKVLSMVEAAEWTNTEQDGSGAEYLSLQWTVVKPEDVKGRKIFQKLFISDTDPKVRDNGKAEKKRDRARKMFAAIDANAGGKLAKKGGKPSDDDIMLALSNKLMVIRLGVWSLEDRDNPNGPPITGNWVSAVAGKGSEVILTEAKTPAPQRRQEPASGGYGGGGSAGYDDEIPF